MSFFSTFGQRFLQTMEKRAAVRVHEYLQNSDTSLLMQAGISLELFNKGPSAYPWRDERTVENTSAKRAFTADEQAIREGIAELKACSDSELNDLGITRASISDAVRFGRPGIEGIAANQDRQAAA